MVHNKNYESVIPSVDLDYFTNDTLENDDFHKNYNYFTNV